MIEILKQKLVDNIPLIIAFMMLSVVVPAMITTPAVAAQKDSDDKKDQKDSDGALCKKLSGGFKTILNKGLQLLWLFAVGGGIAYGMYLHAKANMPGASDDPGDLDDRNKAWFAAILFPVSIYFLSFIINWVFGFKIDCFLIPDSIQL